MLQLATSMLWCKRSAKTHQGPRQSSAGYNGVQWPATEKVQDWAVPAQYIKSQVSTMKPNSGTQRRTRTWLSERQRQQIKKQTSFLDDEPQAVELEAPRPPNHNDFSHFHRQKPCEAPLISEGQETNKQVQRPHREARGSQLSSDGRNNTKKIRETPSEGFSSEQSGPSRSHKHRLMTVREQRAAERGERPILRREGLKSNSNGESIDSNPSSDERKNALHSRQSRHMDRPRNGLFTPSESISSEQADNSTQKVSRELYQKLKARYNFYLSSGRVVFPIEDTLFDEHPELRKKIAFEGLLEDPEMKPLGRNFTNELQVWNLMAEHPGFFGVTEKITLPEVVAMIEGSSVELTRLFKNMHNFFLRDLIAHKFEDYAGDESFPFLALWKYAQENGFFEAMFRTQWNKFMLVYVQLQIRQGFKSSETLQGYHRCREYLEGSLERGSFALPGDYDQLLDYFGFLLHMCFDTHTFKVLINEKMEYFRDNNRQKNELHERRRGFEHQLGQLKAHHKELARKEKLSLKKHKKLEKQKNHQGLDQLLAEESGLKAERQRIEQQRAETQDKIEALDNSIYELSCIPEFSNVWLLGKDKHHLLYWFVKQNSATIYREDPTTGQWSQIDGDSIDRFQAQLNLNGLRERKLYDRMNEYRRMGFLRTEQDPPDPTEARLAPSLQRGEEEDLLASKGEFEGEIALESGGELERFSYGHYHEVSGHTVALMILKSEWMMSNYLLERKAKWTTDEGRHQYIRAIMSSDLRDEKALAELLRTFNEKICVVEIDIAVPRKDRREELEVKTRKIQTKIWGINEKYKHHWYSYLSSCRSLSDIHFLVSVLYLTIERYVHRTRKNINTKYFYKLNEPPVPPQHPEHPLPPQEQLSEAQQEGEQAQLDRDKEEGQEDGPDH